MSITVAVALITSLSTIGGGFIGSAASLIISHNQSSREKATKRREIRRAVYLQLLNKFDEIAGLLEKCWLLFPPEDQDTGMADQAIAVMEGLRTLESAVNVVQLEGPAGILDVALKAYELLDDEFALLVRVTIDGTGTKGKRLWTLSNGKYHEARDSRSVVKEKFIEAASKALN